MALNVDADDHLRIALIRLIQTARSKEDREIIDELLNARQALTCSHRGLAELHPNRRNDG